MPQQTPCDKAMHVGRVIGALLGSSPFSSGLLLGFSLCETQLRVAIDSLLTGVSIRAMCFNYIKAGACISALTNDQGVKHPVSKTIVFSFLITPKPYLCERVGYRSPPLSQNLRLV